MLRSGRLLPVVSGCLPSTSRSFASSATRPGHAQPRKRLDLDPSLEALLKDVDMSLMSQKHMNELAHKELDVLPTKVVEDDHEEELDVGDEDRPDDQYSGRRKSPAAQFGSQHIGAVVVPMDLQRAIGKLVQEVDKSQLHNDAKRLFLNEAPEVSPSAEWSAEFNEKYKSYSKAARFALRDGAAFATVALPAHYSAIVSVFDHMKRRLGPELNVKRVIDWGAATGSGLWASLHSFQKPGHTSLHERDVRARNSTVDYYLGTDKRDGLTSIGKRLMLDAEHPDLTALWQKKFHESDRISRSEGQDALALSAFSLSSLPTPIARKAIVKEMWESGAHTIVIIDHSTAAGFEAVAEARAYLLKMGQQEFDDPEAASWNIRGAHVVAPCPHDKACPLHSGDGSRLVCGFTQRLQRPIFVRKTKHSGSGHEDMEYSYIVIRRGPRPVPIEQSLGRMGEVGKWALEAEKAKNEFVKHLQLDSESVEAEALPHEATVDVPTLSSVPTPVQSEQELAAALRLQAFEWPRLVFTPLKKSGHIILDACTSEGRIMRMTIPRSQGKQPYYDARKSAWGDIFPHPPKNSPQVRHQPSIKAAKKGSNPTSKGGDIGKRGDSKRPKDRLSYDALAEELIETRKKSRRDFARASGSRQRSDDTE